MLAMRRTTTLLCIIICATALSAPAAVKKQPPITRDQLAAKLRLVSNAKSVKGADCGIVVRDLTDSVDVLNIGGNKPLIPASNQKLLTTACALETFGREHSLKTRLYTVGPVGGGKLRGNLVVVGAGDPNISSRLHGGDPCAVFKAWGNALKNLGVKHVTGDLIGDDRLFDRTHVHPSWPKAQLHKWYCAPVGALVFNDSCLDITLKGNAKEGEPVSCTLSPPTKTYTVRNTCTLTSKVENPVYAINRKRGARDIFVTGRFRTGTEKTIYRTVDEPGLYFVEVLYEELQRLGIKIDGRARLVKSGEKLDLTILVAEHTSTLATTLAITNKQSQNLYAEQLFKLLGAHSQETGTFTTGAIAISAYLKKCGVPEAECKVADGSGMSRINRISANAIVLVLDRMFRSKDCYTFWASLSVGGMDGTLKERFSKSKVKGRVAAKSGYLSGVSSLSGYVATPGGRYFAFSCIFNKGKGVKWSHRDVLNAQKQICTILFEHGDRLKK